MWLLLKEKQKTKQKKPFHTFLLSWCWLPSNLTVRNLQDITAHNHLFKPQHVVLHMCACLNWKDYYAVLLFIMFLLRLLAPTSYLPYQSSNSTMACRQITAAPRAPKISVSPPQNWEYFLRCLWKPLGGDCFKDWLCNIWFKDVMWRNNPVTHTCRHVVKDWAVCTGFPSHVHIRHVQCGQIKPVRERQRVSPAWSRVQSSVIRLLSTHTHTAAHTIYFRSCPCVCCLVDTYCWTLFLG